KYTRSVMPSLTRDGCKQPKFALCLPLRSITGLPTSSEPRCHLLGQKLNADASPELRIRNNLKTFQLLALLPFRGICVLGKTTAICEPKTTIDGFSIL